LDDSKISSDNSTLTLGAALLGSPYEPTAEAVVANVTLQIGEVGTVQVLPTEASVLSTAQQEYNLSLTGDMVNGTIGDNGPPAVIDSPPKDLDEDGLYEDIRGDGELDILDVQGLFTNLDNGVIKNYTPLYNFQKTDSEINILDVQALFNELDGGNQPAPANFQVSIDSTNSPVTEGENLTVNVTIENTGDEDGTQSVTVEGDSLGEVSKDISVASGTSTVKMFSLATESGDAGTYTVTATSADDSDDNSVTVQQPTTFSVSIAGTNSPVVESDDLTVTATIENTGDEQGDQTVDLDAKALGTDSTQVTLAAGASRMR